MNPFDERLDRALSSDTADVVVAPALGEDLIRRGRARRRRNIAALGAMSTVAIALAGIAVVTSIDGDPGAIATDPGTSVSVDSTNPLVAPPPTSSAPTTDNETSATAPETTEPGSASGTLPPESTSTSTSSTTSPSTTSPTTSTDETSRSVGVEPVTDTSTLTVDKLDVEFGRTGQIPERDESFVVSAGEAFEIGSYELWSPTGRAATLRVIGCGDINECGLAHVTYDGSALWAVLERRETIQTTETIAAFLLRADLQTGELTQAYAPPPRHALADVSVTDDGRVLSWEVDPLSTPNRTSRVIEIPLVGGESPSILPKILMEIPTADDTITSAVFSNDGRRLGWATAFAREGRSAIHTVDLADGSGTSVDLTDRPPFYPLVIEWLATSNRLLVADGWEDVGYGVIDIAAPDQIALFGTENMFATEAACAFDDGTIARSTWQIPYAEGSYGTGDVVRVDADGNTITAYGLDIASNAMACLTGGRVAVAEYANNDPSDFESPRRLSIVTPDGAGGSTTTLLAEGPYAIVVP